MALKLNLYKNNNLNSPGYGNYYARVENSKPMSLTKLAKHMHQHNSPYDVGTIQGVLTQMVSCIRELALEGRPVKLDNLAIIKCSVTSKGVAQPKDFDLNRDIKAVKLTAVAVGEFSRKELGDESELEYTSLAKKMRAPVDDGGTDDGGDDDGGDDDTPDNP